jgi:hypothetical protein
MRSRDGYSGPAREPGGSLERPEGRSTGRPGGAAGPGANRDRGAGGACPRLLPLPDRSDARARHENRGRPTRDARRPRGARPPEAGHLGRRSTPARARPAPAALPPSALLKLLACRPAYPRWRPGSRARPSARCWRSSSWRPARPRGSSSRCGLPARAAAGPAAGLRHPGPSVRLLLLPAALAPLLASALGVRCCIPCSFNHPPPSLIPRAPCRARLPNPPLPPARSTASKARATPRATADPSFAASTSPSAPSSATGSTLASCPPSPTPCEPRPALGVRATRCAHPATHSCPVPSSWPLTRLQLPPPQRRPPPTPPPTRARSKATKAAAVGYRATLFGATGTFSNATDPHGFRVGELAAGAPFPPQGLTGDVLALLPGEQQAWGEVLGMACCRERAATAEAPCARLCMQLSPTPMRACADAPQSARSCALPAGATSHTAATAARKTPPWGVAARTYRQVGSAWPRGGGQGACRFPTEAAPSRAAARAAPSTPTRLPARPAPAACPLPLPPRQPRKSATLPAPTVDASRSARHSAMAPSWKGTFATAGSLAATVARPAPTRAVGFCRGRCRLLGRRCQGRER